MSSRMTKTEKLAIIGMMIALAFILSYLESLLPPIAGIPGIKPGFANITVLAALYLFGKKEAAFLSLVRVILVGITFQSLFSMLYSLSGAVLSFLVMLLMRKIKKFSITGVSIAGGVVHNLGQIVIAYVLMGEGIVYYLPFLTISGAIAGMVVGLISALVISRLYGRLQFDRLTK